MKERATETMDARRACDICEGDCFISLWADSEYDVLRCDGCGLTFLSPQPDAKEISDLYLEDYFQNNYLPYEEEHKDYFRKTFGQFVGDISPRRLLDVGSGSGFFLEVARELGWQGEGVETADSAMSFAQERGLKVAHGGLLEQKYPDESFDMVTLWDVVEHLSDPLSYLQESFRIMKKGGYLLLKTPNKTWFTYWVARMFSHMHGKSSALLYVPMDLYHFTPKSLTRMVTKCGFAVDTCKFVKEMKLPGYRYSGSWLRNVLVHVLFFAARSFDYHTSFILRAQK